MKLQKTTLILVLLAFGLGGFVYFYEIAGSSKREAAQAKQNQLFSFDRAEIKLLTIKTANEELEFEQQKNKDGFSQWRMKAPTDTVANDASISFLLNLLVNGKSDRSFTVSPNRLQEYGLDKPLATVGIKLANQKSYQLILRKENFDKNFLYSQIKSGDNNAEIKIFLVSPDFQYAVKRPLSEWKQQP